MDYLPVFLRLEGKPVVVVGGGEVAARKVQWLLRAGARVRLIAPEVNAALAQRAAAAELAHRAGEFATADLRGAVAVVGRRLIAASTPRCPRLRSYSAYP